LGNVATRQLVHKRAVKLRVGSAGGGNRKKPEEKNPVHTRTQGSDMGGWGKLRKGKKKGGGLKKAGGGEDLSGSRCQSLWLFSTFGPGTESQGGCRRVGKARVERRAQTEVIRIGGKSRGGKEAKLLYSSRSMWALEGKRGQPRRRPERKVSAGGSGGTKGGREGSLLMGSRHLHRTGEKKRGNGRLFDRVGSSVEMQQPHTLVPRKREKKKNKKTKGQGGKEAKSYSEHQSEPSRKQT